MAGTDGWQEIERMGSGRMADGDGDEGVCAPKKGTGMGMCGRRLRGWGVWGWQTVTGTRASPPLSRFAPKRGTGRGLRSCGRGDAGLVSQRDGDDRVGMPRVRETSQAVHPGRDAVKPARPTYGGGKPLLVGMGTGLAFVMVVLMGVFLSFGGGSIAKGYEATRGGMELFLKLLLLPTVFVVVVATMICRIRGPRFTLLLAGTGLSGLLIHDMVTSSPQAQLKRIAGVEKLATDVLPEMSFEDFHVLPTFKDGTRYQWIARCPFPQAEAMAAALELERLPEQKADDPKWPYRMPDPATTDFILFFGIERDDTIYFKGSRGFVAGYSPVEGLMRLGYSPRFISKVKEGR